MLIRLLHSNCEQNLASSKLLLPGDLISPPAVHLAYQFRFLGPVRRMLALARGLGLLYVRLLLTVLIAIFRPSIHSP